MQEPTYRTINISPLSLIQATIISCQNKCNNFLTHIPASTLSLTAPSPPNEQEWPHKNWTAGHITLQLKASQEFPIVLHKKSKAIFINPRLSLIWIFKMSRFISSPLCLILTHFLSVPQIQQILSYPRTFAHATLTNCNTPNSHPQDSSHDWILLISHSQC